jgi:hypothetical protein
MYLKLELPVWMIKRLQEKHPDMSIQGAIKCYLKEQLNNETRAEHFKATKERKIRDNR